MPSKQYGIYAGTQTAVLLTDLDWSDKFLGIQSWNN